MAPAAVVIESDVMRVLELEDESMVGRLEITRVEELFDSIDVREVVFGDAAMRSDVVIVLKLEDENTLGRLGIARVEELPLLGVFCWPLLELEPDELWIGFWLWLWLGLWLEL